jgi:fatty acid desaturase
MRRLQSRDLALHVVHISSCAAALVVIAPRTALGGIAASVCLFLAAFSLAHDVSHSALRLPRRANEAALAASALVMLVSGHAMRLMHLRHHGHTLAKDDLEGLGARLPLLDAFAAGPRNMIDLRMAAWRAANRAGRAWQIGETLASIALAAMAMALPTRTLALHVGVSIAMQMTMSVWASHVPHNAPVWMTAFAERLAFTRSPVLLSLAYHDLHHRKPGIPCHQLHDDR